MLYAQVSRSRERDILHYEIRGNATESIRIHVYRHNIILEHKVTYTTTEGVANRCTSHLELEDVLYGYARPKTVLNMKQVCKIAYFNFRDSSINEHHTRGWVSAQVWGKREYPPVSIYTYLHNFHNLQPFVYDGVLCTAHHK